MKLYVEMARAIGARLRCLESGNSEWAVKHEERVKMLLEQFPHGSGFDSGTKIDLDQSTDEKLVFTTAFHHMNESGIYDGWTDHTVTVTGSLWCGFNLRISGRDRNQIKDLITEAFNSALNEEIEVI